MSYFYSVNRQLNYIFSAVLILIIGSGIIYFFTIIPADTIKNDLPPGCGVVDRQIAHTDKSILGQALFLKNCASCHSPNRDMTGPALSHSITKEQWKDRKKLYAWVRNPAAFMKKDDYTRKLKDQYGSMMTAFPNLTNDEIDSIVEYLKVAKLPADIAITD